MQDIKNAITHLREHQTFPATKDELVKTCMDLKDFSMEDKKWFMEHLPDKTYKSAEEVIQAMGWQRKPGVDAGEESWMQT
jgi:hypothetical protein